MPREPPHSVAAHPAAANPPPGWCPPPRPGEAYVVALDGHKPNPQPALGPLEGAPAGPARGFRVTDAAFRRFVLHAGLGAALHARAETLRRGGWPGRFEAAGAEIRRLVEATDLPAELAFEIREAYRELAHRAGRAPILVAVAPWTPDGHARDPGGSPTGPPTFDAQGESELLGAVVRSWGAALGDPRLLRRAEAGLERLPPVSVAVVATFAGTDGVRPGAHEPVPGPSGA